MIKDATANAVCISPPKMLHRMPVRQLPMHGIAPRSTILPLRQPSTISRAYFSLSAVDLSAKIHSIHCFSVVILSGFSKAYIRSWRVKGFILTRVS